MCSATKLARGDRSGSSLSWVISRCAAIPVGSALGYVLGGAVLTHLTRVPEMQRWRWAFLFASVPGLLLGIVSLLQRDPRATSGARPERQRASRGDYRRLAQTRSYVLNCAAQTTMTFALGPIQPPSAA